MAFKFIPFFNSGRPSSVGCFGPHSMLFHTYQADCPWCLSDSGSPNQESAESHPFLLSSSGGPPLVDQLSGMRTDFYSEEASSPPSMDSLGAVSFPPFSFHQCDS
jgi:hypothetical protein